MIEKSFREGWGLDLSDASVMPRLIHDLVCVLGSKDAFSPSPMTCMPLQLCFVSVLLPLQQSRDNLTQTAMCKDLET